MATPGERWRFWLETQLEDRGWIAADLVRASGLKDNGRPVIDAPRVSAWLRGEAPSFRLAQVAGEALGVGASEALVAAGYAVKTHGQGEDTTRVYDFTDEGKAALRADDAALPVGRARNDGPALPLDGLTDEQIASLRSIAEAYRAQNPKAAP